MANYVFEEILRKAKDLYSRNHIVGSPLTDLVTLNNGSYYVKFCNGKIFSTERTGIHEIHGGILEKWEELGAEQSFLGFPLSDELQGSKDGRFNIFQSGTIYWTRKTGAHEIHGGILNKWREHGADTSYLGYPITDEIAVGDNKGRYNKFENGVVYWTEETGAHEVHGGILEKWLELGSAYSLLGYPTSDETIVADGRGRFSNFENGAIYWTEDTNAHDMYGEILQNWRRLGAQASFLGYPTSSERFVTDSQGRVRVVQTFENGELSRDP